MDLTPFLTLTFYHRLLLWKWTAPLNQVALNQVVLGPVVLMSVFTWNFVLQRKLDQLSDKVRRDFVPSMLNGWKFWVPAACVNFYVVPLKRQVFFMSACSSAWTGYLSYASQARRS